jgi:hypothetical protein
MSRSWRLSNNTDLYKPNGIRNYLLPKSVLLKSWRYLHKYGAKKYEGYMCWSGVVMNQNDALIRSCIFPSSIKESHYRSVHAELDISVVAEIGEQVFSKGEFLFAQLHTHGLDAFHSHIDDKYSISHKVGFISIVLGHFANQKFYNKETLVNCSINEHLGEGKWRELNELETKNRFHIIKG